MMTSKIQRFSTKLKCDVAEWWNTFILAISLVLIIWLILVSGCSSSSSSIKPDPPSPPSISEIEAYRIEQIKRGLALFEGGHFADAAGCFEKAAALTGGKESIVRQCLMAAAVSHLVINDRDGFSGNILKIKGRYQRADFLLLTDGDAKLKHLIDLYGKMTKGGKK